MRDRKKSKGTKARVQAYKKRLTYVGHSIIIGILVAIIAVSGFLLYSMLNSPPEQTPINPTLQFTTDNPNPQLKAAIVDHLSLTAPNQTFIQTATNTLKQAGYTVDYYSGEQVTVKFYRNLPTHGYKLIILRVHSALMEGTSPPVILFTSESYDKTKYVYEQLVEQLMVVSYASEERERGTRYFGIGPLFVSQSMKNVFQNTVIIMMGCNGLAYTETAEAFIKKGAKVYISWAGAVSASHTDLTTAYLLQHFLIEKRTLKESVLRTFKEVGPDSCSKNLLIYYPLEVGEQTIENITDQN